MAVSDSHRLFPPFRLDPRNARLWRGNQEIRLRRKTFDVLLYLADRPGQLVTKAALLDAVWPDVSVSDSMPATCVAELRKALGDEAKMPRFVETVHGRGYRFVAEVKIGVLVDSANSKPTPASAPNGPKPIMVGRDNELAELRTWYSQALEGQRRVIFIAGEPGIGKTTFLQAFVDSIAQEATALVGRGQCIDQYGAGEPYMPVLEALSRLSGEAGGQHMIELLRTFAPTWLAQMPGLLAPEECARLQAESRGATQQRMLREMTQALEVMSARSPLVLSLEDLHWSDFSTLELLTALARRTEPARLMVIGTYRPAEILAKDHPLRAMKQELKLHRYCEELRLPLLSEEDVGSYLATRLSSNRFSALAPVIHARTDGNPLFVVNMIDYLLRDVGLFAGSQEESQELTKEEWTQALSEHRLDALNSIRQMVERDLERLKEDEQEVLEGASVVGVEFSAASVAAALCRQQEDVERCCAHLARNEQFISAEAPIAWPDGTVASGFRFHHALYQDVLYSRVPAGQRLQLHQRIAVREELAYVNSVAEVATELAHHYGSANNRGKAIQYLQLAGERAVSRGATVEAEGHYRRALYILSELPPDVDRDRNELSMQIALGAVLRSSKSWSHPESRLVYARAQKLAECCGETSEVVTVLFGVATLALGSGEFSVAERLAERMLTAAERSGDRVSLCTAHSCLGAALLWQAKNLRARQHLESANDYYDETDRSGQTVWITPLHAIGALVLGYPDRARNLMKEGQARAGRCLDPFWMGHLHMWAGMLDGMLRRESAIYEHGQALRRLATAQPVWNGVADFYEAKASMMRGKWQEAARYLQKAAAFHNQVGLFALVSWIKLDQAACFAAQGQIGDALTLLDAVIEDPEFGHLRSQALRQRADLFAKNGAAIVKVESAYRAAIECARGQEAKYLELEAATAFARWLKSQDRLAEVRPMLADLCNWFTEGFDTFALKEAETLLGEINSERDAVR